MSVVRLNTKSPTPYLRKHWHKLVSPLRLDRNERVVDLGGGNGRNTRFLQQLGFRYCTLVDKAGDYGVQAELGDKNPLPFRDEYADIILLNYVMMFIEKPRAISRALSEINRIAAPDCTLMVEIQWLPDNAHTKIHTQEQAAVLTKTLQKKLHWDTIHASKYRFIAQKPKTK